MAVLTIERIGRNGLIPYAGPPGVPGAEDALGGAGGVFGGGIGYGGGQPTGPGGVEGGFGFGVQPNNLTNVDAFLAGLFDPSLNTGGYTGNPMSANPGLNDNADPRLLGAYGGAFGQPPDWAFGHTQDAWYDQQRKIMDAGRSMADMWGSNPESRNFSGAGSGWANTVGAANAITNQRNQDKNTSAPTPGAGTVGTGDASINTPPAGGRPPMGTTPEPGQFGQSPDGSPQIVPRTGGAIPAPFQVDPSTGRFIDMPLEDIPAAPINRLPPGTSQPISNHPGWPPADRALDYGRIPPQYTDPGYANSGQGMPIWAQPPMKRYEALAKALLGG